MAHDIKQRFSNLTLLPYDLADRDAINQMLNELTDVKFDAIINNAAEFIPNKWDEFNEEAWNRSIAVNMTAPLLLIHGLKSNLNDHASIVNIVSTDAYYAAYDDIGYAASKAGLVSITKSQAPALALRNIRVNAIAPGWVDTEMAENAAVNKFAHYQTPLGRNATPQEIADVAEFLISDKSSFITASVLNVDGGYSSVDYVIKKESER